MAFSDQFKIEIINQYLICECNSPYLYIENQDGDELRNKVNYFIVLHILEQSGHFDDLEEIVNT